MCHPHSISRLIPIFRWPIVLYLIFVSLQVSAMTIEVAVDRNPVNVGESFEVTFTTSDTPDGDPDFSPLQQDFEIINQSQSNQSSWINGKTSQTLLWTVQLIAKHPGTLTLPAIAFGKDSTLPLSITVTTAANTPQGNNDTDIFFKVEASPKDPYIQAQVIFTMRLYRRINITQAKLDEPSLADAVVQKLGEDSNYNSQVNGVPYVVTERKYAIFPQKSGTLNIPPLNLTAEVLEARQPRFNGFFNQQATQTRRISSEPLTLEVRPAPNTPKMTDWLPAEDVQLKQEWSGDINNLKVGEPITRTLILIAKGATVGLLPELGDNSSHPQFKSYPDQPNLKELPKIDGMYAFREEKIALIPSVSGSITLAAIEVPWFNTQTQHLEVASIPATTLQVNPGANATQTPPAPTSSLPIQQAPTVAPAITAETTRTSSNTIWPWLALFLGSGWLVTLGYLFITKQRTQTPRIPEALPEKLPNFAQQLKQSCQKNDIHTTQQILLAWGAASFNTHSLGALADLCDARLRDEILILNALLYAPNGNSTPWEGKRLLQAFNEQNITQKFQRNADDGLEPLYRV